MIVDVFFMSHFSSSNLLFVKPFISTWLNTEFLFKILTRTCEFFTVGSLITQSTPPPQQLFSLKLRASEVVLLSGMQRAVCWETQLWKWKHKSAWFNLFMWFYLLTPVSVQEGAGQRRCRRHFGKLCQAALGPGSGQFYHCLGVFWKIICCQNWQWGLISPQAKRAEAASVVDYDKIDQDARVS